MSGIFNGDSIYKSGGGGGGYSDGGTLVDSDFIKVENNTISTYTNTSRSDINFYFEVQTGEVLNAVIELTNEYNATVHVYILQNGFYIPLGNVGGDTVNAGNDYNLTVVGNSFILEVFTPTNGLPDYVYIDGDIVRCAHTNNNIWVRVLGSMVSISEAKDIVNQNYSADGYRLPNHDDFLDLASFYSGNIKALRSVGGWNGTPGTNESGFNAWPGGYSRNGVIYANGNSSCMAMFDEVNHEYGFFINNNDTTNIGSFNLSDKMYFRVVKTI